MSSGEATGRSPSELRAEFEAYIRANIAKLNSIALGFTHPDQDLAKDLVQESLIKGYKSFCEGKLQLDDRARAWFMKVIQNDYFMHRRKFKRMVGEPEADVEDRSSTVEQENISTRELLTQALEELPDDQRQCVVLIDIQQLDYQQAADFLGVPVGTVRSRLSRARLKLAGKLAGALER
jgi:RNA polymerase sigma-70 factor, ECF subfamily